MSKSLNDVLNDCRPQTTTTNSIVNVTLTIHSQVDVDLNGWLRAGDAKRAWYGYGFLYYVPSKTNYRLAGDGESLATMDLAAARLGILHPSYSFRVLNNLTYSTVQAFTGTDGAHQTFLAAESEQWSVRIEPVRRLFSRPQITFTLPNDPGQPSWSVKLTEEESFLRGVGRDPVVATETALYVLAFGSVLTGLVRDYQVSVHGPA